MSPTTSTSVTKSVVVKVPADVAFKVFTTDIGSWWPKEHHIIEAPLAEMVFEPHVGGNVYDRGTDGSECRWSRVLAFEPPHRVVFSWDISLAWQLEADPAKTSEIEIRFDAEGPNSTKVTLEHRHIDHHGEGWEAMRDAVSSDGGWGAGLRRFASFAETGNPGD
jgi:uncharacterized protein YndB with AHSA1/START domain